MQNGTRVFVPMDTTARSLGGRRRRRGAAAAKPMPAAQRSISCATVRAGCIGSNRSSRSKSTVSGSPMGPVTANDVDGLFDADFLGGAEHPLALGPTESIPWLAEQSQA